MPVPSVVKRYQQVEVKTYNTASDGMVLVDFSNGEPHISKYRESVWPFWFAN
jgi:beta-lactamase superfamily II metal-dependent hydrolase